MFLAKQGRSPYPAGAEGNHMIADIQPIEIAGEHWVRVIMDDHELAPRGPYPDADTAGAVAARFAAVCRAMHTEVHMQAAARNR